MNEKSNNKSQNPGKEKRKFVPSIAKALNKQSRTTDVQPVVEALDIIPSITPSYKTVKIVATTLLLLHHHHSIYSQDSSKPAKRPSSHDRTAATGRGQGRKSSSTKDRPQHRPEFVASYSIFESGVGFIGKTEQQKTSVGLCEQRTSTSSGTDKFTALASTKLKSDSDGASFTTDDPLSLTSAFISDVKQLFKDKPLVAEDSARLGDQELDPLKYPDLSIGRNHTLPYEFFNESSSGRLFTIQLPEHVLPENLDDLKEGRFGKLQLLDNQKVRLVVGEAVFDIASTRPPTKTSDVVLANQVGERINLDCVGHIEQEMLAVAQLDEFVKLGM